MRTEKIVRDVKINQLREFSLGMTSTDSSFLIINQTKNAT